MSPAKLDRARFAKCRALMERGLTRGEREAGAAAAERVAAAAGLSLAEALRLCEAEQAHDPRVRAASPPRRPPPWQAPPPRPGPITVEEIRAQKAATLAHLKRRAARERKRLREAYARQTAEQTDLRAAQAARDGAWAEGREEGD